MSQQNILIFESELRALAAEANRHANRETGGDLYGLWTYAERPVIFLATGPGPRAEGTSGEFQQDTQFMMESERFLQENFGLQYLGDWHSHHWINLREPSGGDGRRVFNNTSKRGWTRMAEIIVTHGGRDEWAGPRRQLDARSSHADPETRSSGELYESHDSPQTGELRESGVAQDSRGVREAPATRDLHQAEGLSASDQVRVVRGVREYGSHPRPAFECVHPYLFLAPQEMRPPVPATLGWLPGESPVRSALAMSRHLWRDHFQTHWSDFPAERIKVTNGTSRAVRQWEPQEKAGFWSRFIGGAARRSEAPEYARRLMGELDLPYDWEKEGKRGGWLSVPIENLGTLRFYVRLSEDDRPQIRSVELRDERGHSRNVSHALKLDEHNRRPDSLQRAIMELITHGSEGHLA